MTWKRFVAVKIASVASSVWVRAAKMAVATNAPYIPAPLPLVDSEDPVQDPVEEIDQTEVVAIVRRWENDDSTLYVDYGEMDTDIVLAMMLRGMFNVMLEDVLPMTAEGDD